MCVRDYITKGEELFFIREVILKKKLLPFGHFPKGGGGKPESKSFGVVFFGPFGHFGGKGGVEPIPKVLG